jgi:hypothetical protein
MYVGDQPGGAIELRPRSIGGILDTTLQLYRRHFLLFITVQALVVVPMALLDLVIAIASGTPGPGSLLDMLGVWGPAPRSSSASQLLGLIELPVDWCAYALASGAATLIASAAILGQAASVGGAYRLALSRVRSLLWVDILTTLAVGLIAVTVIGIPFAIYVAVGWSMSYPAVVLERRGGTDAMGRSRQMVAGHRWRLLACQTLVSLLAWVLIATPGLLFEAAVWAWRELGPGGEAVLLALQVGNTVCQALGHVLFDVLGIITATLLYYDLRIRDEAFDLEHRASQPRESVPDASLFPGPDASTPPAPPRGVPG